MRICGCSLRSGHVRKAATTFGLDPRMPTLGSWITYTTMGAYFSQRGFLFFSFDNMMIGSYGCMIIWSLFHIMCWRLHASSNKFRLCCVAFLILYDHCFTLCVDDCMQFPTSSDYVVYHFLYSDPLLDIMSPLHTRDYLIDHIKLPWSHM